MKSVVSFVVVAALVVGAVWFVWLWGFCRFYVSPNQMAVITAKVGDPLPPGRILAGEGQKGVRERVLGEGRHFLNPILYQHSIVPVITIPAGKVGIVTSKIGDDLPEGEFLAEPGQKGIWRRVLGPGRYRMNPGGYQIDIADAISIPIGYVGVLTSLSGEPAPEGEFAVSGQKGVRKDILQPGLYYINPREFKVDALEIGVNQVSLLGRQGGQVITKAQIVSQNVPMKELQSRLLMEQQDKRDEYLSEAKTMAPAAGRGRLFGRAEPPTDPARAADRPAPPEPAATFVLNQFVEFPSRDGFQISLDMTVEFELLPDRIASILRKYGDLPAAVDKIIMPQILSVSRLKGSAYGARDFIVGEGREKFQQDLTEALARTLAEREIVVHNALIRHVDVPMQILDPIQQASIAQEQDLTNKEKQNTARKQAELNTEITLIEQRRQQVGQETEKIKAEIRADQQRRVAEIQAETLRQVAEIEKKSAALRAERAVTLGQAEAGVTKLVEGEKAKGFQLKINAFGDPVAYNLWTLAQTLNPDIRVNILHAGDGTLWTDLQKAGMGDLGGATLLQQQK
jgi:regulator of protease activity HflC (stomatin/prohibitin superfamily)